MNQYYENTIHILMESLESMDEDIYKKLIGECVETLKGGGKIIASGLGKNVPICEKFVGTMNSLGMDARFLHTNTAIHGDLGIVEKKDLVMLLSKSGNTLESVMLAEYLLDRGTSVWLLTFSERCRLAEILEKRLVLRLESEGDQWDIIPNNSTSVYLIILQGMALEIAEKMDVTLENFRANHPGGGIGAKLRGEALWN